MPKPHRPYVARRPVLRMHTATLGDDEPVTFGPDWRKPGGGWLRTRGPRRWAAGRWLTRIEHADAAGCCAYVKAPLPGRRPTDRRAAMRQTMAVRAGLARFLDALPF